MAIQSKPQVLIHPGQRYGRLVVESKGPDRICPNGSLVHRWTCLCDCGRRSNVAVYALVNGRTKSCGCLRAEHLRSKTPIHGESDGINLTTEYRIWCGMRKRCSNPKDRSFYDYGGRGITVCERWQHYPSFLADVGRRPSSMHTLDRIDNDGPYSPENCRWIDSKGQARNKRNVGMLEVNGVRKPIPEWAELARVASQTVRSRLRRGWSAERAVSTPSWGVDYGIDTKEMKAKRTVEIKLDGKTVSLSIPQAKEVYQQLRDWLGINAPIEISDQISRPPEERRLDVQH